MGKKKNKKLTWKKWKITSNYCTCTLICNIYIYIYTLIYIMCVTVRERLHKGGTSCHLHGCIQRFMFMLYQLHFGREILEGISRRNFKCDLLQQNHARHRSYRQIHPPLKNVIYTLGVKSISKTRLSRCRETQKKCFWRSMGSTISIFSTPLQRNTHFSFGKITAEGC